MAGQTLKGQTRVDGVLLSRIKRITDADSPYTVQDTDFLIEGNTASGAITINLPKLADSKKNGMGREIWIKQVDGSNAITVDGNGAEAIDGSATLSMSADNDCVGLRAGTDDWLILSQPTALDSADIAAGAIDPAHFAVGALSADATGRAVMASGYFTEAHTDTAFAASAIDDDRLKGLGTTRAMGGRDIGRACVGYFYLTGAAGDTELVTINARTYEFDTNATSTGDVAVDISGDATADAACTALAAAINGDGSAVVEAVVMAGNSDVTGGVMLLANTAQATNYTLTTSAALGVVSGATLANASAIARRDLSFIEYTVTAADVTTLARTGGNSVPIAGIPSTTAPTLLGVFMRTSAGALVVPVSTLVFSVTQVNSNFYVVSVDDSAATLGANDTIAVTVAI